MTYRAKINELTETRQSKTKEHGKFPRVSVGPICLWFAEHIYSIFKSLRKIVADCRSELRYAPIENCWLCKRSPLSSPATAIVKDSFRTLFCFFLIQKFHRDTQKDTNSKIKLKLTSSEANSYAACLNNQLIMCDYYATTHNYYKYDYQCTFCSIK